MHNITNILQKTKKILIKHILLLNTVLISFVFISSTYLFYKQLTVRLGASQYKSDLLMHLKFGIEGKSDYSLMLKILGTLWHITQSRVVIAIFLGLIVTATVFALSFYIKKVIEYLFNRVIGIKCFIPFAFFSIFLGSIYIPFLSPIIAEKKRVYHLISAQVWHNSTYLAMRLIAPLVLVAFYAFYKKREVKIRDWLVFTILLSITNATKPSFFIAFAPSVLVVLIYGFIKSKGKNLVFSLKIGIAVICSMPIMFYQSYMSFGEPNTGVKFSLAIIKEMLLNTHSYFWVLANLAVPLLILIYSIKAKEINRIYIFGWLMFLVGWLESLFIVEIGLRANHGNFAWQNPLTALFLYIVSAINLVNMYKKNKISKKAYLSILVLLSLNVICGMVYYLDLLQGYTYLN